jgi:hypothetical protein
MRWYTSGRVKGSFIGTLTSYKGNLSVQTKWASDVYVLTSYGQGSEKGHQHNSDGAFFVKTRTRYRQYRRAG